MHLPTEQTFSTRCAADNVRLIYESNTTDITMYLLEEKDLNWI